MQNYGRKQGLSAKAKLDSLKVCSKLSRVAVYHRFCSVVQSLREAGLDQASPRPDFAGQRYSESKAGLAGYQAARATLLRCAPFDGWVGNGPGVQDFYLLDHPLAKPAAGSCVHVEF